jgi:glycine dehydrogenase subunit 1
MAERGVALAAPNRSRVHPYIPNSIPAVKARMLADIEAADIEELYASIPESLRMRRPLDIPPPLTSEAALVRHVEGLLGRNRSTREVVSFLGAGAYQHHVPAVCDEVNSRTEFLTAYAGDPYEDHGRFQALFEYESMMGELLTMDVVNVPTYDGFQAAATALAMTTRITGRRRVVVTRTIGADKLAKLRDYLHGVTIDIAPLDGASGEVDLVALAGMVDEATAGVYLENPSFLGIVSTVGAEVGRIAHDAGALFVVGADPISLGVLAPPLAYGADIACGDIQSLGMHLQYGGYIGVRDDPTFVMELPSRLFGLAPTSVEGEYGFGDVAYERTSFALREEGKEWVGTAAALWGITAGVYLALMGPQGMTELGDGIMARTRYAMERLATVPGVGVGHRESHHFREFVVDFGPSGRSVREVNVALLERGIFGGYDLSRDFPELGQAALYCVTEIHTEADIDGLAAALTEVLR